MIAISLSNVTSCLPCKFFFAIHFTAYLFPVDRFSHAQTSENAPLNNEANFRLSMKAKVPEKCLKVINKHVDI